MNIQLTNPVTGLIKDELEERNITQASLAKSCGVSSSLISDILNGNKQLSTETAFKFENALELSASWLLKIQLEHEIRLFQRDRLPEVHKSVERLISA